MERRGFLSGLGAVAGTLILPYEPKRIYSFQSIDYIDSLELTNYMLESRVLFPLQDSFNRQLYWNIAYGTKIRKRLRRSLDIGNIEGTEKFNLIKFIIVGKMSDMNEGKTVTNLF